MVYIMLYGVKLMLRKYVKGGEIQIKTKKG